MNKLIQKYQVLTELYNGPKSKVLMQCRETIKDNPKEHYSLENILLNDAIVYFGNKYLNAVKNILSNKTKESIEFCEVFNEEIVSIIKNTKKQTHHISNIQYKEYQVSALNFLNKNRGEKNLIIMPTGYGKTIVSFVEMVKQLKSGRKVVFSAPTNALVEQQYNDFLDYLLYSLDDEILANKTKLGSSENASICFVTNHCLLSAIKNEIFTDEYFYVIDEAHEGEGKLSDEEREYKYPSMKAFENFSNTYGLLALSGTPTNFPILEEKLGINNVFYGSDKSYFKSKSRQLDFSEGNDEFMNILSFIEDILEQEINNIMDYINHFKETSDNKNTYKKEISPYTKSKLKNTSYFDANKIKNLQKIFDKKEYHNLYQSLWNYKKILELRKKLYQNDYKSFYDSVKDELALGIETKLNHKVMEKRILDNTHGNKLKKEKLSHDIKKLSREVNIKRNYLSGNEVLKHLLQGLLNRINQILNSKTLHPKVEKLFEIIYRNKGYRKTVIVHVENSQVIENLLKYALENNLKASYLKGGSKTKKDSFIDKYTKENIKNGQLDVVFVTSVFKLGVNFDIEDLVFYHPPKNIKDLLQFEGRVGRYSSIANIYYLGVKGGFEVGKVFQDIKKAKQYLKQQFSEAENSKSQYLK